MKHYLEFPSWISPVIIPGLPFHWYGLMYIIVIVITYLLFQYQAKQEKFEIKKSDVEDLFIWCIVGALIGARIFAVTIFSSTNEYLMKPWLIFWPFRDGQFVGIAGMNYYGGIAGLMVAYLIFVRIKKLNGLKIMDLVLCGFPLAYTFGRIGNFINGELYGRVTDVPWGMVFPHAQRFPTELPWVQEIMTKVGIESAGSMVNLPRHPTQIYEAFLEGILLWAVIWFFFRKRRAFDGLIVCVYLIGYGLVRFFVDYFRMPLTGDFALKLSSIKNPPYLLLTPLNLTMSQIFSFLMVACGIIAFFVLRNRSRRESAGEAGDAGQQ
ncbi:MAG: prolipoprotein diacylglyceryl transferase [Spirochaetota bacterium]